MATETPDRGVSAFDYVVPNAPVWLVEWDPAAPGPQSAKISSLSVPYPSRVVTAVVDTGVFPRHPGLIGNQIPGKDFMCGHPNCLGAPDDDGGGHGTNMAGVVAAHDVEQGVYGVAWNTHFMPLRGFGDSNSESDDYTVGSAIAWAVQSNVDVINLSWGSPCPLKQTEQEIHKAYLRNVLLVTAAGNGHVNIDDPTKSFYPAHYKTPNMIVVMAHLEDPIQPWAASNYGAKTVDIAAPGARLTASPCAGDGCYTQTAGSTSMATAYVSGAAALLKSVHLDWTAAMLKIHLLESSWPEPWLAGQSKTGARVIVDRALNGPLHVVSPAAGVRWSASRPQSVAWSNDYTSSLCTSIEISISVGGSIGQTVANGLPNNGQTTIRLDGVPHGADAVVRVACLPGRFTAASGAFLVGD